MAAKPSDNKMQISQPPLKQFASSSWIVEQVTILAEAMGESVTPARLKIYTSDLADIEQPQLQLMFTAARRECRFFPKIAELRELAGFGPSHRLRSANDTAIAAWLEARKFCERYVGNDPYGNWGPQYGWYQAWPELGDKILDSVRAVGGWRTIKLAEERELPFLEKRFIEAFVNWNGIQREVWSLIATQNTQQQLPPAPALREHDIAPVAAPVKPKPVPVPLSDEALRARRALLKQQLEQKRTKA